MPRTSRASVGGICNHVLNHGNGRVAVYRLDAELAALRLSISRGRPFGAPVWQKRTATRLGLESSLRPRGCPAASDK